MRELFYSDDSESGIGRRRSGCGFAYRSASGRLIRDRATKARIKALAIPPAWTDVWICPAPNGHVQATGRDARGRKQYIYHPQFRAWREAAKFEEIVEFAVALPRLRRRVAKDLLSRDISETLVLATAVRVLERTLMRIGNDSYASQNGSYGLTTLQEKHVRHLGSKQIRFAFRGKGGKPIETSFSDGRIASILRRLEGLPGQNLFQFVDEQGEVRRITSEQVNAYIRATTGGEFSAKDFRTWAATVLAVQALLKQGVAADARAARRNVTLALETVARRLCNTVAVCRSSYVHPAIIEGYLDGTMVEAIDGGITENGSKANHLAAELHSLETEVLRYLRKRTLHSSHEAKAA